MTKVPTACSFIVRVYRIDMNDPCRITGQVETMDGSGTRLPFTSLDELSDVLQKGADRRNSGRGAAAPKPRKTQQPDSH